jgi:hypothetical protein
MRPAITTRSACARERLLACAALAVSGVVGCLQKVDGSASSAVGGAATDAGLVTKVLPSSDPIALDPDDQTKATMDACEKTRQDKRAVLTAYCASCHAGTAAVGLPPWDFVLDDQKLVSSLWMREGQPAQRFVIPGDPDHSALYQRMAVVQDMPPQPTDLGTHRNARPTASDNSIVREWILHCIAGASGSAPGGSGGTGGGGSGSGGSPGGADAAATGDASTAADGSGGSSTGGASQTGGEGGGGSGGSSASGGAPGSGGTVGGARGSGGSGSTRDGGTADGGGGTTIGGGGTGGTKGTGGSGGSQTDGGSTDGGEPACASGVSSGDSCSSGAPSCKLGSKTCTCVHTSGTHKWSCK